MLSQYTYGMAQIELGNPSQIENSEEKLMKRWRVLLNFV
jgi:hypothetical protein